MSSKKSTTSVPNEEEDIPQGNVEIIEDVDPNNQENPDQMGEPNEEEDEAEGILNRTENDEFYCVTSFLKPDQSLIIASGCQNDCVYLNLINSNNTSEESSKKTFILKAHRDSVTCLSFSPDGRFLASGGLDGQVFVWNTENGDLISCPEHSIGSGCIRPPTVGENEFLSEAKIGTTHPINWVSWHPSPKLPLLAAGDSIGRVRLWNATNGECKVLFWTNDLSPNVVEPRFLDTPDAESAESGKSESDKPAKNQEEETEEEMEMEELFSIAGGWTPNGSELWSCGAEGVKVFKPKADSAKTISMNYENSQRKSADGSFIPYHSSTIRSAAISKDGAFIVSGDEEGSLRIVSNSSPLRVLTDLSISSPKDNDDSVMKSFECTSFSSDGRFVAAASLDGSTYIWEKGANWQLRVALKHGAGVTSLRFNPAVPHLLVTGAVDGSVKVWDIRNGQCLETLREPIIDMSADYEELPMVAVTQLDALHLQIGIMVVVASSQDGTLQMFTIPEVQSA